MGCVFSSPSVSHGSNNHYLPDPVRGRTEGREQGYTTSTFSDWNRQQLSTRSGDGAPTGWDDRLRGFNTRRTESRGDAGPQGVVETVNILYSSQPYSDWYGQNFMAAESSRAPGGFVTQSSTPYQEISQSVQAVSDIYPAGREERVKYISALSDAVRKSSNRIQFANPNSLNQFMNKMAFEQNYGSSSDGPAYGVFGFESDFKNDEIFSEYTGSGWLVRSGLDFSDVINNRLFGPKEDGTTYYFDCSEFVQAIQLYALYNSVSPSERQRRFDNNETYYIGSFNSTGVENKYLLSRETSRDSFVLRANYEALPFDEREMFSQIPIGSRVTFTNSSSSANFTDFKNESTIKVSKNKVAALGLDGNSRVFGVGELKLELASMDSALNDRILSSGRPDLDVEKELKKRVFISEVAVFDTPLSKDFSLD